MHTNEHFRAEITKRRNENITEEEEEEEQRQKTRVLNRGISERGEHNRDAE